MEDSETVEIETASEVEAAENTESKQVVNYPVTLQKIAELEKEYKEIPTDLTVKANYEIVKKRAAHLRTLRGEVEKRRKELKADALAYGKLVDSTAKEITERLLVIEEPIATAKKDFDTAAELAKREAALKEERRVDGIAGKIASIRATVEYYISKTSTEIQEAMVKLADEIPAAWADEFKEKAEATIIEVSGKLKELYAMKLQQEQAAILAAEAEAKRKQEEEEARIERERLAEEARLKLVEEQAKLAEERRQMEAERDRMSKEAEEKAAQARAEQAARDAQAKAEREKLEKEIADLKAQQEERKEVKVESGGEAPPIIQEAEPMAPTLAAIMEEEPAATFNDQYRAAGNAMLKTIGNKETTKRVLDSIINGDIPYIQFTGAAQ
jgi:hypothetical protein